MPGCCKSSSRKALMCVRLLLSPGKGTVTTASLLNPSDLFLKLE
jgi:hypothetical protein